MRYKYRQEKWGTNISISYPVWKDILRHVVNRRCLLTPYHIQPAIACFKYFTHDFRYIVFNRRVYGTRARIALDIEASKVS